MSIRYLMLAGKRKVNGLVKETKSGSKTDPLLEASTGFEPVNEGFADPCLTTWPRRLINKKIATERDFLRSAILQFERAMRFELTTFSLARRRSTTELRPRLSTKLVESAETQDRTGDTAIFSRVLYQLSYLGQTHIYLLSGGDFTRTYVDCQEISTLKMTIHLIA